MMSAVRASCPSASRQCRSQPEVEVEAPAASCPFSCPSSTTGAASACSKGAVLQKRLLKKQRYFGSVELLISVDNKGKVRNAGRFRIEPWEKAKITTAHSPLLTRNSATLGTTFQNIHRYSPPQSPIILENPEIETRWYFQYFLGREHQNYAGVDALKQPFFLSVVVDDSGEGSILRHRAILWTKSGSKKLCLPYNYPKPASVRSILKQFASHADADASLREIDDPKIQKELLVLEEQEGSVNYKFGVVFAKSGQITDSEMLSNENAEDDFQKFLNLLGEEIILERWSKYSGGLDTKTNSTGLSSVYTVFEGHEIMFHVSTKLPFSSTPNSQQIERKRHIGNDIVNIVFEVTENPETPSFNPSMMKSQFTHIFALVTYRPSDDIYFLWVFSEESVPIFGPALPNPPVFSNAQKFRDFLLTKLINGEKAAFQSKAFAEKRERTMDMLIKDMYMDYLKTAHKPLSRMDSVLLKTSRQKKDDQSLLQFIKIGQGLKLEKVLNGDAPLALATSGLYRKQDVEWSLMAGDSWGNKHLVLASDVGGLYVLAVQSDLVHLIVDKTVFVKQVFVLENFGLLLMRAHEKNKDAYLCVCKLESVQSWIRKSVLIDRSTVKDLRVDNTKGCYLLAITENSQLLLHVAVCVSSHRLRIFQWKYSLSCPPWCLNDSNLPSNFELVRELSLTEDPLILCLYEAQYLHICVGYKHQFDLINLRSPESPQILLKTESKVTTCSILSCCEDDQSELLLTYNNVSIIYDLTIKDPITPLKFYWNFTPIALAYVFPFVMAFSNDTMEIRLAVNGSLLSTALLPGLKFISSKDDVYFSAFCIDDDLMSQESSYENQSRLSNAAEIFPNRLNQNRRRFYMISLQQLIGLGNPSQDNREPCHLAVVGPSSSTGSPLLNATSSTLCHHPLSKQRSNPTPSSHLIIHAQPDSNKSSRNSLSPSLTASRNSSSASVVPRCFTASVCSTRGKSLSTGLAPLSASLQALRSVRDATVGSDSGVSGVGSQPSSPATLSPNFTSSMVDPFSDIKL